MVASTRALARLESSASAVPLNLNLNEHDFGAQRDNRVQTGHVLTRPQAFFIFNQKGEVSTRVAIL